MRNRNGSVRENVQPKIEDEGLESEQETIETCHLKKQTNSVLAELIHNPGFRSLRICADLQDFFCRVLQRSLH